MDRKVDLRILKTKKNLYEALILLLKEKPFEEIKVSDICEKSLINRSTFYAHYEDKYDLFATFIQDLKENFAEELRTNQEVLNPRQYYIELIRIFLDHVEAKRDLYFSIMIHNKNSIIMDMVYDTLNEELRTRLDILLKSGNTTLPSDIVCNFYLGAVFQVGMVWLRDGSKYTKQDLTNYLEKLIPDKL